MKPPSKPLPPTPGPGSSKASKGQTSTESSTLPDLDAPMSSKSQGKTVPKRKPPLNPKQVAALKIDVPDYPKPPPMDSWIMADASRSAESPQHSSGSGTPKQAPPASDPSHTD